MIYSFRKKLVTIAILAFTVASFYAKAAVPVHINSGNPAFPFPQFLEYAYGDSHRLGNMGTKNVDGLVHAEMEQDIRDAYQIHANEFEYTGEEIKPILYFDEETNEVKGKCKLKPYKKYFAFEIREDKK